MFSLKMFRSQSFHGESLIEYRSIVTAKVRVHVVVKKAASPNGFFTP